MVTLFTCSNNKTHFSIAASTENRIETYFSLPISSTRFVGIAESLWYYKCCKSAIFLLRNIPFDTGYASMPHGTAFFLRLEFPSCLLCPTTAYICHLLLDRAYSGTTLAVVSKATFSFTTWRYQGVCKMWQCMMMSAVNPFVLWPLVLPDYWSCFTALNMFKLKLNYVPLLMMVLFYSQRAPLISTISHMWLCEEMIPRLFTGIKADEHCEVF